MRGLLSSMKPFVFSPFPSQSTKYILYRSQTFGGLITQKISFPSSLAVSWDSHTSWVRFISFNPTTQSNVQVGAAAHWFTLDPESVLGDDDATDAQCTIMTVPNILDGDILNHLGPYQGIYIGTIYCT